MAVEVPIKLYGRIQASAPAEPMVLRLSDGSSPPERRLQEAVWLPAAHAGCSLDGFSAVLDVGPLPASNGPIAVQIPPELGYLQPGDIVRVHPSAGTINVLYRKISRFNSLLVTERCNSFCVMCSQPPRDRDDGLLVDELLQAIPLMAPQTPELGITGGEPTLLHGRLLELIAAARDHLPATALHMLSNGRLFAYLDYARAIAELNHPDFVIGIPLYSDLPWSHDFVVQAKGAFDQTVRGMLNLARYRQRVEIRVVIHRHTFARLPQLGRFIARNLPFAEHVALMGLELMGHTRMNLDALWADPLDYQQQLADCVEELERGGVRPVIYNHQLCVLPASLWPYAAKSISDWKNVYLEPCAACSAREQCGGFFASGVQRTSRGIAAVRVACGDSCGNPEGHLSELQSGVERDTRPSLP